VRKKVLFFDVLTGNMLGFKGSGSSPVSPSDASCLKILIGACCCALATEFDDGDFLRFSMSASIELDFGKGLNLKLLCEDA
jgi:hypothetical protein